MKKVQVMMRLAAMIAFPWLLGCTQAENCGMNRWEMKGEFTRGGSPAVSFLGKWQIAPSYSRVSIWISKDENLDLSILAEDDEVKIVGGTGPLLNWAKGFIEAILNNKPLAPGSPGWGIATPEDIGAFLEARLSVLTRRHDEQIGATIVSGLAFPKGYSPFYSSDWTVWHILWIDNDSSDTFDLAILNPGNSADGLAVHFSRLED